MHAILASVGTGGDILPYVGLGKELRARGHQVTLVAPEDFAKLAADHELAFRPLVSVAENHEVLSNPDFWHRFKAAPLLARWGTRFIDRQYRLLAGLSTDEDAVIVANPGVLVAKIVADKFSKPLVNLILQPGLIPSSIAPPVMFGWAFPRWLPRFALRLFWRGLDAVGDILVGREVNRLRVSLGLQPVRRFFQNWLSRELVIAMFPPWYAQSQPDWPRQIQFAGFPMFDPARERGFPANLVGYFRRETLPLLFTFGTGMMHAHKLFEAAVEACRILDMPGLFVTRYPEQIPGDAPPCISHCEFASFAQIFPRCMAVVHHGGIGTMAQAFATARPQVILPFAFDQTDNAVRVKKLKAGDWLKQSKVNGLSLARALDGVMSDDIMQKCWQLAGRFKRNQALALAAEMIETAADHSRSRRAASSDR